MLYPNINELKENYLKIISESQFKEDFNLLLIGTGVSTFKPL